MKYYLSSVHCSGLLFWARVRVLRKSRGKAEKAKRTARHCLPVNGIRLPVCLTLAVAHRAGKEAPTWPPWEGHPSAPLGCLWACPDFKCIKLSSQFNLSVFLFIFRAAISPAISPFLLPFLFLFPFLCQAFLSLVAVVSVIISIFKNFGPAAAFSQV